MINEIDYFYSLLPTKVKNNTKIVTKEEVGQDFFLHISNEKMSSKKYIPFISKRAALSEDRTVPRITVSPQLTGCIVGFVRLVYDQLYYDPNDDRYKNYKQGVYIHAIDFEYALKPNNKLVYDQSLSNEHWLVTYNQDTREFKGRCIGKLFIQSVLCTTQIGKPTLNTIIGYIEISDDRIIQVTEKTKIGKGYYKFTMIQDKDFSYKTDKFFIVEEVTKEEYSKNKELSAALLSI